MAHVFIYFIFSIVTRNKYTYIMQAPEETNMRLRAEGKSTYWRWRKNACCGYKTIAVWLFCVFFLQRAKQVILYRPRELYVKSCITKCIHIAVFIRPFLSGSCFYIDIFEALQLDVLSFSVRKSETIFVLIFSCSFL